MEKRLKACSLIPTGQRPVGSRALIRESTNRTSEERETTGNSTARKTGRWHHVLYEHLYLGSKR